MVRSLLAGDRLRHTEEVVTAVDILVASASPLIKEVWRQMRGWYKADTNHPTPPVHVTLEHMTEERVMIYRQVPPPGTPSHSR